MLKSRHISQSRRRGQGLTELVETVSHGAVDDGIPDRDRHAAQQRGLDLHADFDRMTGRPLERLDEPQVFGIVELDGRAHLGDTPPPLLGSESCDPLERADEIPDVAGLQHVGDKSCSRRKHLASKQVLGQSDPLRDRS